MSDYVLEVSELEKLYGTKKIIRNVNLKIKKGDIYGFLGRNGAGKTTTIKMILNLLQNDKGTIKIDGYDVKKQFNKAISRVGAVVETPRFYTYLSAYDNLRLIANLHPDVTKKRISELLHLVGLSKRSKDKVKTYSLGMKQRLGIARALLNNPSLVILDEPTNGLDPQGIKEIREIISQLAIEQDITFLISTHLLYEVEQICNKVAILQEGSIIAEGAVKDLLDNRYEIIEIHTKPTNHLPDILKNTTYIKSINKIPNGLEITLEKSHSGKLNQFLISNNIIVDYVIPIKPSLEEYFISITQGGNHNA